MTRMIVWGILLATRATAFGQAPADEPKLEGKPLDEWIARLKSGDERASADATRRLIRLGSEARPLVPKLVEMMLDGDSPGMQSFQASLILFSLGPHADAAVPTLIQELTQGDTPRRAACADLLGMIGPAAKPAIPALIAALDSEDHNLAETALRALVCLHPEPVPIIVNQFVKSQDWQRRHQGLTLLAQLGPAAEPAVPVFMDMLRVPDTDEDSEEVQLIIRALARIGPAARAAVPKLTAPKDLRYRLLADTALASIEPEKQRGEPAWVDRLADIDADGLWDQIFLVAQVDPLPRVVIQALAKALPDTHSASLFVTAPALAGLDRSGDVARPALLRLLEAKAAEPYDEHVIWALSSYGPKAQPAVPTLVAFLKGLPAKAPGADRAVHAGADAPADPDETARRVALMALARIDPGNEALVPAVLAAINDRGKQDDSLGEVRASGIVTAGLLRHRARAAVPALLAVLDKDSARHSIFARFFRRRSSLLAVLDKDSARHRVLAAEALLRIGAEAPRARDAIIEATVELLNAPDFVVMTSFPLTAVARAESDLGDAVRPLVPILAQRMRNRPWLDSGLETIVLAGLGPVAADAIPALRAVLADPRASDAQRDWTALALGRIDPNTQPHLPKPYDQLDAEGRSYFRAAAMERQRVSELILFGAYEGFRRQLAGDGELLALLAGSAGWNEQGEPLFFELMLQAHSGEPLERAVAVWALMRSAPVPRGAVPTLIAALDDEYDLARAAACYGLGVLGSHARSATEALKRRRDDPNEARHVRAWAAQAVEAIEAATPKEARQGP